MECKAARCSTAVKMTGLEALKIVRRRIIDRNTEQLFWRQQQD